MLVVEADESLRIRLEGVAKRYHEDHIAAKWINSLSHYNLVHKISHASSIKNTRCKGGSGERIGNFEKIPAGMAADESQKQKKKVIDEARIEGRKVHFASLSS